MAEGGRQVRVFVSSPGDTRFERSRLDRVTQRLNGEFQGVARLTTIRWETEFYRAHDTFQRAWRPPDRRAAGSTSGR